MGSLLNIAQKNIRLDQLLALWAIFCSFSLASCGPDADSSLSIFGGEPVDESQLTGVVALAFSTNQQTWEIGCSGTLVAPKLVVTAAHCIRDLFPSGAEFFETGTTHTDRPDANAGYRGSLGDSAYVHLNEQLAVVTGSGVEGGHIEAPDSPRIIAAGWNPLFRRHPMGQADIAWIKLASPIEHEPIQIASSQDDLLALGPQTQVSLAGFGRRNDTAFAGGFGRKFSVSTTLVERTGHEAFVGGEGLDACYGDSGGPLLWEPTPNSTKRLIGVINRGRGVGCGHGGIAALTFDSVCNIQNDSGIDLKAECATAVDDSSEVHDFLKLCHKVHSARRTGKSGRQEPDSRRLDADSRRLLADSRRLDADSRRLDADSRRLDADSRRLLADGGPWTPDSKQLTAGSKQLTAEGVQETPDGKHQAPDTRWLTTNSRHDEDTELGLRRTINALLWATNSKTCQQAAKKLANIRSLDLDHMMLSDLRPLANLPKLQTLSLRGNRLVSVGPLIKAQQKPHSTKPDTDRPPLPALKSVDLWGNFITDVDRLAQTRPNLKIYGATWQYPGFLKTTFLHQCKNPGESSAQRTVDALLWKAQTDACTLANERLIRVASLNLSDRSLTNVEPIRDFIALEHLDLSDNPGIDITPLRSLERLRSLDLTNSRVSDLTPLRKLMAQGLSVIGAPSLPFHATASELSPTELSLTSSQTNR